MREGSSFYTCNCVVSFHLAPVYAASITEGIREHLNRNFLLKYSDLFHGVAVSYSSVRIHDTVAKVIAENPFLQLDADVEFTVFAPEPQDRLQMQVTNQSEECVSGLVLGYFNATATLPPASEESTSWDPEKGCRLLADGSPFLANGSIVGFVCQKVRHGNQVLVIEGELAA